MVTQCLENRRGRAKGMHLGFHFFPISCCSAWVLGWARVSACLSIQNAERSQSAESALLRKDLWGQNGALGPAVGRFVLEDGDEQE